MGIDETLVRLRKMVEERDWDQFHTPENLAKSISIEAAELLERFQWSPACDLDSVSKELADVLTYCLLLSDKLGLDPLDIVEAKMLETMEKYPIEKTRGSSEKYDRL